MSEELLAGMFRTLHQHESRHYGDCHIVITPAVFRQMLARVGADPDTVPSEGDRLLGLPLKVDPTLPESPGYEIRSPL